MDVKADLAFRGNLLSWMLFLRKGGRVTVLTVASLCEGGGNLPMALSIQASPQNTEAILTNDII